MRSKSTLVLFILVLITGGYMLVFERTAKEQSAFRLLDGRAVRFAPESLKTLALKNGELEFECVRTEGKWMLSSPVMARASVEKIDRIVTGLASLRRRDAVAVDGLEDFKKYGFDEPRVRLEISDNQGVKVWLIGRDAPLGKMLYVMEEGGTEAVVTDSGILSLMPEKIEEVRDRTIFAGKMASVNRIDIRHKAGFVQLGADASGNWRIQQPAVCSAANASVAQLLESVSEISIEKFVSDEVTDMAIYGLQQPRAQIMLAADKETGAGLLIGNEVPDSPGLVYAKQTAEYAVFAVSTNALALLEVDLDSLRDRRLLPLPISRLRHVSVEQAADNTKLALKVNEGGVWKVTEPRRWDVDPLKMALFLNIWQTAKIDEYVLQNEDLSDPRGELAATYTFDGKVAEENFVLKMYRPKTDGAPALCSREGEDVLFAFRKELLQISDLKALDFKNRNILGLVPDQVGSITQVIGTNTVVLARDESAKFVEPLNELWAVLSDIEAVTYVAENPDTLEAFGLDKPYCRLTIALTDDDEIGRVLLIGGECHNGRYAMVQGSDVVFVMEAVDADKLCGVLTDKPKETVDAETK